MTHLGIVGAEEVALLSGTGAQVEEGTRYTQHHFREVLGTHLGLGDLYPVVPEQFPDIAVQFRYQRTVVDGGGEFRVPLDLRGGAEGGGNSLGNLLQTALGMHPHLLIERRMVPVR